MPGLELPKLLRKGDPGGQETPLSATRTVIKSVPPGLRYRIGRSLAFTLDESSIQMVAARHRGPEVALVAVEKVYLPTDDARAPDRDTILRETIDQFINRHGGVRPTISVTLTGRQTAHRTVTLPQLRGTELRSALAFEARRQIPFPEPECWSDFRVTQTINREAAGSLRASILAATRSSVEAQLAPFRLLGRAVEHVYHTPDVIGRLLRALPDFDPERYYTLIDVHRRSTEIAYYRGDELEFYHVSSLGSSFLANRSDPTVFEYFAESLATEVQNSLDYYTGQFVSPISRELYIYGDLSYSEELIARLTDRFGYAFRPFPIEELSFVRGRKLPFEGNIGVCLPAVAAATNRAALADLSPADVRTARRRRRIDRAGIFALSLVGSLLLALALALTFSVHDAREHLAELQERAEEIRSGEMFVTYNHLKRRLAANQAFMDKASEDPSYLGLSLKELSRVVPETVRLYDVRYQTGATGRNVQMSGLVTTKATPPEVILAELVENLTASPFFEDVVIERHIKKLKDDEHELDFHLSLRGVI
jgi:Tfp pilus assembly PilM family ATPase